MLARNLSLASAMTLVGLGLFANAGVNLATSGQGRAFGEDRRREAVPASAPNQRVPPVFEENRMRGVDGGADAMAAGAGDGCVEGMPLEWLGEIREFPRCWQLASQSLLTRDVDRDGNDECFTYSGTIVQADTPLPSDCALGVFRSEFIDHTLVQERRCLLTTDRLALWVLERTGYAEVVIPYYAWVDLDSDGDLDLVVEFFGSYSYGEGDGTLRAWIENIAATPLTGDLNHDGSVNAADLTMLLGGWTGN